MLLLQSTEAWLRRRLVTDRDTGKPKGYGFCEFYDLPTSQSAQRNLNGHEVGGRALRVDFADDSTKPGARSTSAGALPGGCCLFTFNASAAKLSRSSMCGTGNMLTTCSC